MPGGGFDHSLDKSGLDAVATLFGTCDRMTFDRHDTVVATNGTGGALLIVTRGSLVAEAGLVEGQRQVLGFFFPGDFLCTCFNRNLVDASAGALATGELIRVPHAIIRRLVEQDGVLGQALVRTAARQMERCSLHNLLLGRLNVQQRVASFALEMVRRCGRPMVDGALLPLPMTREDIGDYLGLNADTVSRTLSGFRKKGILEPCAQGEIFVKDVDALENETPLAEAINARFGGANRCDLLHVRANLENGSGSPTRARAFPFDGAC